MEKPLQRVRTFPISRDTRFAAREVVREIFGLRLVMDLSGAQCGDDPGDDSADADFEPLICDVTRDCDCGDDQHVLGHRLTAPTTSWFNDSRIDSN